MSASEEEAPSEVGALREKVRHESEALKERARRVEEERIEEVLKSLSLREKVGQMTQLEKNSCTPEQAAALGLGSVLSGGGGNPANGNTAETWLEMTRGYLRAAGKVPLLYGADAVHGHNNVGGSTIFPHNIGLGCTRDADLVRRVGRAVGLECAATGVNWNFAPCLAVPHDVRWGRSYEGFSADSAVVAQLGSAFVEGLTGAGVLPSVKHFVGDGATTFGDRRRGTHALAQMGPPPQGRRQPWDPEWHRDAWKIDTGVCEWDEERLRRELLPPYRAAIAAGALNVMCSYSSWKETQMHGHRYLLTDVLKGELGFRGFVVTDWGGIDNLDRGNYGHAVVQAINAGIDMVMVPFQADQFIHAVEAGVA
ncbi:MAG: glycoside hydrolase family 3 N-terminal domain-containing protein, partial [archaeon]|nr:glycoside hydrolase family 3 N-terminal domain-containing protein [archaeon]